MEEIDAFSPSVTVCNDWTKVVNVWHLFPSLRRRTHPGIVVFLVVQLLGLEDSLHLVWNGSIRVIAMAKYYQHLRTHGRICAAYPRSGPTSLNPVVNVLEATQPEMYTTSE